MWQKNKWAIMNERARWMEKPRRANKTERGRERGRQRDRDGHVFICLKQAEGTNMSCMRNLKELTF